MQCPRCFSHAEHIYTFESDPRTGKQWAIERCPNCNNSAWDKNPVPYADYLKDRAEKRKSRRYFRNNDD